VSKRLGAPYSSGNSRHWLKVKNPAWGVFIDKGKAVR
jgi:ATP-dependent DNA ligase